MEISIKSVSDLAICSNAIRTCWNSFKHSDNGKKDLELINRVGNKYKHKSTLEHIVIQAEIKGISRALLQQLSRHRHISLSVKSTRYTLKELKDIKLETIEDLEKYCVLPPNIDITNLLLKQLKLVREMLLKGYSNDYVKYALPEAFKTDLYITLNIREFQHIYNLRSSTSALWEFRLLVTKFKNKLLEFEPNLIHVLED